MLKAVETRDPVFLPDDEDMPGFGRSDGQISEDDQAQGAVDKASQKYADDAHLLALGASLADKFKDVEQKRLYIEDRWLEDLRQFHGRYDPNVQSSIVNSKSCSLFLNVTKPKTNAFAARVMDMVLPTDDKNWGLEATPVPEIAGLDSGLKDAPASANALQTQAGNMEPGATPEGSPGPMGSPTAAAGDGSVGGSQDPNQATQQDPNAGGAPAPSAQPASPAPGAAPAAPPAPGTPTPPQASDADDNSAGLDADIGIPDQDDVPMTTPEGAVVLKRDIVKAVKVEADRRCAAMEDEINDQLSEAKYNGVQRKAIDQMAKLGTGIIMGPVVLDEWRDTWKIVPNPTTKKSDYVKARVPNTSKRPGVQWVDCWNFYPDMSASDPDEWGFAFVQYLVNDSTFRKYGKRFNFDKDVMKDCLAMTPFNVRTLRWMNELRDLSETNNTLDNRYRLLRYYGELDEDDLRAIGKDPEAMGLAGETISGIVWLCEGRVLKIDLNPLDSGDMPFSVCYTDKDEASPFGRGIPRIMRGEQESINATWRMKHDNAGLSVCPQVVMKANAVVPADGDYHMKPKKLWYVADETQNVNNVFSLFPIDSHQAELDNLLQLAIKFADDVTQLPLIMQGDAPVQQTAQGMALLYNSSTVVLRRCVKFYDDGVSEPLIERFYDWNMQFNDREDIKGDFRAIARGSATLLDKEQQGKALDTAMQMAMQPTWQPYTNMKKLYLEALKGKRILDVMNDDETIDKNLAQQAQLAQAQAQAKAPAAPPQRGPTPDQQPPVPGSVEDMRLKLQQGANDAKGEDIASRERVGIGQIHAKTGETSMKVAADLAAIKIHEDAENLRSNMAHDAHLREGTGL